MYVISKPYTLPARSHFTDKEIVALAFPSSQSQYVMSNLTKAKSVDLQSQCMPGHSSSCHPQDRAARFS